MGFSQVLGGKWEPKCALDSLDIVSCSSDEDCEICSDCNTGEDTAFCTREKDGVCRCKYTVLQKYTQFCLLLLQNAYVLEGGNEGGREATPTSISIFDFYGIKAL